MPASLNPLGAVLLATSLGTSLAACAPDAERAAPARTPALAHTAAALPALDEPPLLLMADQMALVIDPAAGVLDADALRDPLHRPRTHEAWQAIADAALSLDRAALVLREPAWSLGRADWLHAVGALRESARAGAEAARRRDLRRLTQASEQLRNACNSCHERYAPDVTRVAARGV